MTDRLHFDDLTAITCPFGLLDDDTQARLRAWPHGVGILCANATWKHIPDPSFCFQLTYRARPAPLVQDSVDWSHVGPAVNHIARDEDGRVSAFADRPEPNHDYWATSAGNIAAHVDRLFPSYVRGTVDWRDSLISRPGAKE